jgi:hypothetical protein
MSACSPQVSPKNLQFGDRYEKRSHLWRNEHVQYYLADDGLNDQTVKDIFTDSSSMKNLNLSLQAVDALFWDLVLPQGRDIVSVSTSRSRDFFSNVSVSSRSRTFFGRSRLGQKTKRLGLGA